MNRAPKKFYFDCEFHEHDVEMKNGAKVRIVELISIGVIDEAGRQFTAVNSEFDREVAEKNHFLKNNVLNRLPPESEWKTMDQISGDLLRFVGTQDCEFHYWQAPQDPFLLFRLLAPRMYRDQRPDMLNIRENVKGAYNLAQKFNDIGRPKKILPPAPTGQHDPLVDAEWNRAADKAMDDYKAWKDSVRPPVTGVQPN